MLLDSGIWNYMENIRCVVMDLSLRVSRAQQNVQTIKTLMQQWKDKPLFRDRIQWDFVFT